MKVLNKKRDKPTDNTVYVGRPPNDLNEHFGNAFTHLNYGKAEVTGLASAQDAVDAFRQWLLGTAHQEVNPFRRNWILSNLHLLKGKDLMCWCQPNPCHATVLMELAND